MLDLKQFFILKVLATGSVRNFNANSLPKNETHCPLFNSIKNNYLIRNTYFIKMLNSKPLKGSGLAPPAPPTVVCIPDSLLIQLLVLLA